MPASVVDQVFGRHEAVAPTGMQRGGRGIRKPPPRAYASDTFIPPPPAAMGAQLMTDRAVHLLSTIEVCTKRQDQLSAQLTPLEPMGSAYPSLSSNNEPRRDPIEQAVYDEERDRLRELVAKSRDSLDALYRFADTQPPDDVGPPLDLQAVTAARKAALQDEMLEERMAGLTTPSMEVGPSQPEQAPAYMNSSNTNPHFGGLSDYVHHGDYPPAFRDLPGE